MPLPGWAGKPHTAPRRCGRKRRRPPERARRAARPKPSSAARARAQHRQHLRADGILGVRDRERNESRPATEMLRQAPLRKLDHADTPAVRQRRRNRRNARHRSAPNRNCGNLPDRCRSDGRCQRWVPDRRRAVPGRRRRQGVGASGTFGISRPAMTRRQRRRRGATRGSSRRRPHRACGTRERGNLPSGNP